MTREKGEYIKKEPIAEEVKTLEDFWRKKWKDHDSTANFEDAHIAKAVMNAFKYLGLFLSDLPTYSFPEREKGEWIPASERLPKAYQKVLVTYEEFHWENEPTTYGVKLISFGGVVDFIAWMPLPEPYKAESEE